MDHQLMLIKKMLADLPDTDTIMPVLFIGHGSPMNGIEQNTFSNRWKKLALEISIPKAVLVVSAHWFTKGTRVTAMDFPPTIHDFGGFPKALSLVQYPAPGSPHLAQEIVNMIHTTSVSLDHEWGLDHGTWSIIRHMYPTATIPVLQLSMDYTQTPSFHYQMAKELSALRKKGVLIIGSGNMVHNLRMVAWDKLNEPSFGFDWALQMNETFKQLITSKDHAALVHYDKLGKEAQLAIPTPEHYLPLIYTLALSTNTEAIQFFNDEAVGGSLTMTSVQFG